MVCTELGPPEKLQVQERDIGAPAPGQVVVRVHAAGVNFVDALMVAGQYQIRPEPPFVPGSEVAGIVEQVGEGAGVEVGTRVITTTPLNGFAEQVVVKATALRPMPQGMDFCGCAGASHQATPPTACSSRRPEAAEIASR